MQSGPWLYCLGSCFNGQRLISFTKPGPRLRQELLCCPRRRPPFFLSAEIVCGCRAGLVEKDGLPLAGFQPPPYRDRQRADACQAEREEEPGVWQQPRAEHTNTHTGKISKTSQPHLLRLVTGSTPTNNYLVTKIRRWVEGV